MAERMDMELTSQPQACQHPYVYGTLTENKLETRRKPLIPTKVKERSPHRQVECGINKDQNGSGALRRVCEGEKGLHVQFLTLRNLLAS